jgi:rubrerythrin
MPEEKAGQEEIEGLVRIEETLAEMYGLFAERFPVHGEMWSRLAEEERGHARWIRDLYARVEEGSARLGEDRFRAEGIQYFLNYAEERLGEARGERLPFVHALDMALDLESGLLERKFFQIFETDSDDLKQAFEDMEQQIRKHAERLRKALARKEAP